MQYQREIQYMLAKLENDKDTLGDYFLKITDDANKTVKLSTGASMKSVSKLQMAKIMSFSTFLTGVKIQSQSAGNAQKISIGGIANFDGRKR